MALLALLALLGWLAAGVLGVAWWRVRRQRRAEAACAESWRQAAQRQARDRIDAELALHDEVAS